MRALIVSGRCWRSLRASKRLSRRLIRLADVACRFAFLESSPSGAGAPLLRERALWVRLRASLPGSVLSGFLLCGCEVFTSAGFAGSGRMRAPGVFSSGTSGASDALACVSCAIILSSLPPIPRSSASTSRRRRTCSRSTSMSSAVFCSEASARARELTEFRSESKASPSQPSTIWSSVFSERSVPSLTRVITAPLPMPNRTEAPHTETRLAPPRPPRRSVIVLSPCSSHCSSTV
jgi:hypothetical protein